METRKQKINSTKEKAGNGKKSKRDIKSSPLFELMVAMQSSNLPSAA